MGKTFKFLITLLVISMPLTFVFAADTSDAKLNYSKAKNLEYVLMDKKNAVFKNNVVKWYYNPTYEHLTDFSQIEIVRTIKKAMRSWSRVCSIKFRYKGITMKRLDNLNDGIIVIGFWPERKYERKQGDSAGVAQIVYTSGKGIIDGYIALNIFNRSDEYAPQNLDDLQGIVTHEVGHLIGIGHSNKKESVMYVPEPSYEYEKTLRRDDKRAARRLYPIFGLGILR
jgi:hypothetical protein